MNIKSLILGSAAALVAAPAMAADLPVAEPVDYVRVCDAYGAGYHFIPGTDTCLKIGGYVRAEAQFNERFTRAVGNKFNIWARGVVEFTAKEETELGTLVSYIEIQGDTDASGFEMTKAWLSLGGLYAGLITSASVVDHVGGMYLGDYDLGDQTVGAIGYNADLGNGVSAHIAIENEIVEDTTGNGILEAGQTMPAVAARIKVDQAWGSASLGGVVRQVNYLNAANDSDLGWAVAAGITGKFDALTAALNAVYSEGALGYTAWVNGHDSSTPGKLNDVWSISGMLKYAFADNAYGLVAAGYGEYDVSGTAVGDYDEWQVTAEVGYTPVKNFTVKAGVLYKNQDYARAADVDSWEGKIRLQRDF